MTFSVVSPVNDTMKQATPRALDAATVAPGQADSLHCPKFLQFAMPSRALERHGLGMRLRKSWVNVASSDSEISRYLVRP